MSKKNLSYGILFLFLSSIFLLTNCKDESDPLSPSKDHFEAIGMVIYDASGKQVVKILRGVTADTLKGIAGQKSDHFSVKFINSAEKIIDPPTEDKDHKFAFKVDDETITSIWQHPGEEGGYEFHLDCKKKGNTAVEFFIEHEGHYDFRTGKIPVTVN